VQARRGVDRRTLGRWALNGAAGGALGFILLPLVFVTWLAFFEQAIPAFPPRGYSLKWFVAITENQKFVDGFWLSLQVAVVAMTIGLGAGPWAMARRVLWPLALPGLAAGAVFCFILSMNAYATPVLLGGPQFVMMGPLAYVQFAGKSNWPFGAAVSFILMAATLSLTAMANLMVQRRYRV
jgi:ABC-type spermidine/putrescine transport system permease subunit I